MAREWGSRRLVVLANSAWNLANFRSGLIDALVRDGFAVTAAGGADEAVSRLPVPFQAIRLRSDGLNPWQDATVIARLSSFFRAERAAVVLSFTPKANIYGGIAAQLSGVRAIPNVSGLGTAFIRGGPLKTLVVLLYRLAFRRCPVVFFQNPDDLDLFSRLTIVRPEQARLLPGSGVDLARFQPPPPDRAGGPLRFLFVGRLLGDKGLRELAGAARIVRQQHPEVTFTLLGFLGAANRSAISREELEGWIRDGLVHWAGAMDDVRPYLAQADAVVLPSYREGLPRSLLEAAAMERPMIATDVPGNREIVKDGVNGLLCRARSAESLADALTRFIALSNEERRRMGEAARRTVEEDYGEERVIAAYLEVVRSLVA